MLLSFSLGAFRFLPYYARLQWIGCKRNSSGFHRLPTQKFNVLSHQGIKFFLKFRPLLCALCVNFSLWWPCLRLIARFIRHSRIRNQFTMFSVLGWCKLQTFPFVYFLDWFFLATKNTNPLISVHKENLADGWLVKFGQRRVRALAWLFGEIASHLLVLKLLGSELIPI